MPSIVFLVALVRPVPSPHVIRASCAQGARPRYQRSRSMIACGSIFSSMSLRYARIIRAYARESAYAYKAFGPGRYPLDHHDDDRRHGYRARADGLVDRDDLDLGRLKPAHSCAFR